MLMCMYEYVGLSVYMYLCEYLHVYLGMHMVRACNTIQIESFIVNVLSCNATEMYPC